MKSPAKIGENRFLGNISTSSFRNLLPRSIYTKQKSIQNSDSKSFRCNDENAPPCDPNIQTTPHLNNNNNNKNNNNNDLPLEKKSPQKVFPSATQILPEDPTQFEAKRVLVTRTNSMASEIIEENDSLADQIRELKEELIRTKSDGFKPDGSKSGYFVRESLSQLRNSINKSLVISCANKECSEEETIYEDDGRDVMELSKHINKFQTYSDTNDFTDSIQSSFASASGCEAESMSGDEICSVDKHKGHKDCPVANSGASTVGNGVSISLPHQPRILEEPPLSESPKIRNFRKSVAASTKFQATPRNATESSKIGNKNVQQFGYSTSKKHLSCTDSLASTLQRGLHIIDCHQRSSLSNTSSVSFSFGHLSLKPFGEANNLSSSIKLLKADKPKEGGSSILLCLFCRQKLDQEAEEGYKATEEACVDEKHLKNICLEQANKIEQLTSLLNQYKKNTVQESNKLTKSDDGVNETDEEFGKVRMDLSEKEALLKEIAELKSKFQPTKSTDNLRSSLLLRSFQMRKSIDFTKNTENNNEVLEKERERWTEMESEWISLTDDLRMDIDSHRRHAKDLEMELKKEKMATEELNDALSRAMLGHSRFIEQYTELQEKYDELAERHSVTIAGIVDVKKAVANAAVKGRHGKRFAKAFSAELTAIRAEKEKEREFLKKENKGLKIQLRDTAEAVQAAGELLVRLREAEQAVESSEERFGLIEEENDKLKKQIEKLRSKHKTEMSTMKQYLAESKLPGSALEPWLKEEEHAQEHKTGVVSYDEYAEDQAWRTEFGATYQHHYQ